MNKRNRIQKLWFGVDEIENPLIVTPVKGIHQELLKTYKPKHELGGWYNPSVISLNETDYLVMQIPMGRASEDLAKVIGSSTPVYMLGYCGGLNPNLQIGDVVQDEDNNRNISGFKRVKIQTVNGLLDEGYSSGSDAVDMENELFKRHLENYSGYFVVSDIPSSKPFFQVTELDREKIKQSQTNLIKLLGERI